MSLLMDSSSNVKNSVKEYERRRHTDLPKKDGKLVPKPGNVRDPNRRYSSVSGPEGQYFLEFTDEEERQRDAEEAKWEADAPKREQERKERELAAEIFRESLVYENRVVAFVDILGWRSAIQKSASDSELTKKLGLTAEFLRSHTKLIDWMAEQSPESKWPGDPQVSHFSDSILISRIADKTFSHSDFVTSIRMLLQNLVQLGFLARGGVASGKLFHRGPIAYGPALVRAYDLERSAIYPRVILDSPLATAWGQGEKVYGKEDELLGQIKQWRKDKDGFSFLDFLQPFINMPGVDVSCALVKNTLEPARRVITNGLSLFAKEPSIGSKYHWAASYFNDVCKEYKQCDVQLIDLDDPKK